MRIRSAAPRALFAAFLCTLGAASAQCFTGKWGSFGSGAGQMDRPRGVAVDAQGNTFVTDLNNHRVQKFDSKGQLVRVWGRFGSANGEFNRPYAIAVAQNTGEVFVTEQNNVRVQVFSNDGTFLRKWGSGGSGPGQFSTPMGIAVDVNGQQVFVADTDNDRIQKFDGSGRFLTTWGGRGTGDGQFNGPQGLTQSRRSLYVADRGNSRVQVFDLSGSFQRKWGSSGAGNGQFQFVYEITADAGGNIYTVEFVSNRVQVFTGTGTFSRTWGTPGSGDGQFSGPSGVTWHGGTLFVADTFNHRVQTFAAGERRVQRRGRSQDTGWGRGVVAIADYDGDGYADYGVSAAEADTSTGNASGFVSIYSGRDQQLLNTALGPAAGAKLGSSMASADFDQDGFADVMIGAAGRHSGYNHSIYLLSGRDNSLRRQWIDANDVTTHMAVGRFDDDANPDIVTNFGPSGVQALRFGGGVKWRVQVSGGTVGALAVTGDQDGDGLSEVLVGIPDHNSKAGRFEVRSGRDGRILFARNGAAGEEMGYAVAGVGALRGGWDFDYAVGSPGVARDSGRVRFYSGSTNTVFATSGGWARTRHGSALAPAGDQDGDGKPDVWAGGPYYLRWLKGTDGSDWRVAQSTSGNVAIAAVDTNGDSVRDLVLGEAQLSPFTSTVTCYTSGTHPNPPAFVRSGASCAGTGGRIPRIYGSLGGASPNYLDAGSRIGGRWSMLLKHGAVNSRAVLHLGQARTQLRLDFLGMPGCFYQVPPLVQFAASTDAQGRASIGSLTHPTDAKFIGLELRFQWLILDPTANRLGATMSDVATMRVGGLPCSVR